jgi:hypothetical protein
MRLSDLTILNSSEFGIVEEHGGSLGANTYNNITIRQGNRPAVAITDPLFSSRQMRSIRRPALRGLSSHR